MLFDDFITLLYFKNCLMKMNLCNSVFFFLYSGIISSIGVILKHDGPSGFFRCVL